jgi:hypothetical protein
MSAEFTCIIMPLLFCAVLAMMTVGEALADRWQRRKRKRK